MEQEARDLAVAMLDEKEDRYTTTLNITTEDGEDTGEKIVIIAVRSKPSDLHEGLNLAFKAVAKPAGQPCPMCGGSGRV